MITQNNEPMIIDLDTVIFKFTNNNGQIIQFNNNIKLIPNELYKNKHVNTIHDMLHLLVSFNHTPMIPIRTRNRASRPVGINVVHVGNQPRAPIEAPREAPREAPKEQSNLYTEYKLFEFVGPHNEKNYIFKPSVIQNFLTANKPGELEPKQLQDIFYTAYKINLEKYIVDEAMSNLALGFAVTLDDFSIKPEQLAEYLGLSYNEKSLFPAFEKKYLKYKLKYLKLKKAIKNL
jgi:hypothetical protein